MFDTDRIREPQNAAPVLEALMLGTGDSVTQLLREMQGEHTDSVLAAGDRSRDGKLVAILTERDILLRIVDRSKKPATSPMGGGA